MPGRSYELPVGRGRGGRQGRGRGRARGRAGAAGAEAGAAPAPPRQPITPEKQAELLRDYIELDRRYWPNLQAGTRIRYFRAGPDGFRSGGVVRIPKMQSQNKVGPTHDIMLLANPFNDSETWGVKWGEVERIFIHPDISLVVMKDNLAGVLERMQGKVDRNFRSVLQTVEALQKENAALRAEMNRVLRLLQGRS